MMDSSKRQDGIGGSRLIFFYLQSDYKPCIRTLRDAYTDIVCEAMQKVFFRECFLEKEMSVDRSNIHKFTS